MPASEEDQVLVADGALDPYLAFHIPVSLDESAMPGTVQSSMLLINGKGNQSSQLCTSR